MAGTGCAPPATSASRAWRARAASARVRRGLGRRAAGRAQASPLASLAGAAARRLLHHQMTPAPACLAPHVAAPAPRRRQAAHLRRGAQLPGAGRPAGRRRHGCAGTAGAARVPARSGTRDALGSGQLRPVALPAAPCLAPLNLRPPSTHRPPSAAVLVVHSNCAHPAPRGARLGRQRQRSVYVPLGRVDPEGGAVPQTLVAVQR